MKVFEGVRVGVKVLVAGDVLVTVGVGVGGMQCPVAPRSTETSWEVEYLTVTLAFPAALKEILPPAASFNECELLPLPGSLTVYEPAASMSPPELLMLKVALVSRLQPTSRCR